MLLLLADTDDGLAARQRVLEARHGVGECHGLGSVVECRLSEGLSVTVVRRDLYDDWSVGVLDDPLGDLAEDLRVLAAGATHALLVHAVRT